MTLRLVKVAASSYDATTKGSEACETQLSLVISSSFIDSAPRADLLTSVWSTSELTGEAILALSIRSLLLGGTLRLRKHYSLSHTNCLVLNPGTFFFGKATMRKVTSEWSGSTGPTISRWRHVFVNLRHKGLVLILKHCLFDFGKIFSIL